MRDLPIFGQPAPATERRHPDWIRSKVPGGDRYRELKRLMRDKSLNTVCEEALCPNVGECWEHGRATIMILGDRCTRGCRFCNVRAVPPEAVVEVLVVRLANLGAGRSRGSRPSGRR